jgi:hypothetical protein
VRYDGERAELASTLVSGHEQGGPDTMPSLLREDSETVGEDLSCSEHHR